MYIKHFSKKHQCVLMLGKAFKATFNAFMPETIIVFKKDEQLVFSISICKSGMS